MRGWSRRAIALAVTLVALPAAAEGKRAVVLAWEGDRDEALERTMKELLARRDLEATGEDVATPRLLVRVVVTRTATGTHVVVRSADPAASPVLDRIVPHDPSPAIDRERVALAVRGAAEAELVMEEERKARPPPPPPPADPGPVASDAPPPPPPPAEVAPPPHSPVVERPVATERAAARPPHGIAIDVATYAGAGLVGNGNVVARVGGGVTAGLRTGLRPGLTAAGLYGFPFDSGEGEDIVVRSHLVSARLLAGIEPLHGSRFALALGLGGGLDVLTVAPSSDTLPANVLADDSTRVNPVVTGAITGRLRVASDVVLTLSFLGDVDPATRRYVFLDRGNRETVFQTWSFRPTILAGLAFTAAGPQPFGGAR